MEDLIMKSKNNHPPYNEDWMQILRNQLNIISTSVFLLETDYSTTDKLDKLRYLKKIKEAMERINVIVK